MDFSIDFSKYKKMENQAYYRTRGKVINIVGLTIESAGPDAKMGDICFIYPKGKGDESVVKLAGRPTMAEVVGFRDGYVQLMPYENTSGIGNGSIVENTESPLRVNVGDGLLGQTLDGLGRIDGISFGQGKILENGISYSVENQPPDPMSRDPINEVLPLGVKAVDGLLTVGKGQRIGIFAGSGVGKSTLLGMFARNTQADINVIALIGERGREVREFIERDLGPEGMARSVVVVATSDRPALERVKAAKTATSIAEYFRDKGKDVLLMMEPITDTARSILDGHIVLNRKLAQKNHYPAIDVLQSISRCMSAIDTKEQKKAAGKFKNVMATYNESEDLINIGAYKKGANKHIDYAIDKIEQVNNYLLQATDEKFTFGEEVSMLMELFPPDEDARVE